MAFRIVKALRIGNDAPIAMHAFRANCRYAFCRWAPLLAFLLLFSGLDRAHAQAPLSTDAAAVRAELTGKIMPYWHDTAIDKVHGGYLLADDLKGSGKATEKQLVTQSRMIWGFSHIYRKKLGTDQRDYLAAARQGYQFLNAHFLDRENGGYYWATDLEGNVRNDQKILYGESFAIYALVEYYRASGERPALDQALALFDVIQKRAHDSAHRGWSEHFRRDWTPELSPTGDAAVEVPGLRSANTHLHWMEALTELFDASQAPRVKAALIEALEINQRYFYPPDPAKAAFHRQPDWAEVTAPRSAGLSYGHNVEFAWLMIRAERVLGRAPSWPHFFAYIDHALAHAYDHERGGLYAKGYGNQPASDTDKTWWVQAEMIAALTDAIAQNGTDSYKLALHQLIEFVRRHQADPKDGIWLDTVSADGRPKSTGKAHNWKANYHDVRALVKFIEANPT